ncbi:MAG: SDR family oxidoreductase [Anaerolineae bacterium]
MPALTNQVVVITGGTRGLGLAAAREFAAQGAAVVLGSRHAAAVTETVRGLQALGARASGTATDVSDLAQVRALARLALDTYGQIDCWVNAAGTAGAYGAVQGMNPAEFKRVIETNILGTYYGSRTALAAMLPRGQGKLINLLGMGYDRPVPWQNAYGSSKAWVRAFTLALASENKASGVGIFAYQPGMVLTDLLTDIRVIRGSEARLKVFPTVVRILAQPPEAAARKLAWIATPATDGRTGQIIRGTSTGRMLAGALRELWRAVRRRPAPDMGIRVEVIEPWED